MRALIATLLVMLPTLGHCQRIEVIEYTATWCQPCVAMRPVIERLRLEGVTVRTVDVDANPGAKRAAGVTTVPTFRFLLDGRPYSRKVNRTSYAAIRSHLRLIKHASTGVRVTTGKGDKTYSGSGVVVRSSPGDTVIATAWHNVARQEWIKVTPVQDGVTYVATVIANDPVADVALLSIKPGKPLRTVPLARRVVPGEPAYSVGLSLVDKLHTRLSGRVTAVDPNGLNVRTNWKEIQGRSGGGVFNANHQLIGLVSGNDDVRANGTGLAIHSSVIALRRLLDDYDSVRPTITPTNQQVCDPQAGCNCPRASVTVSNGSIAAAVVAYMRANPPPRGPVGPAGRDGIDGRTPARDEIASIVRDMPELSDLRARVQALEDRKRRVMLVDGKTKSVLDDEQYGNDEPIVLDVRQVKTTK